MLLVGLQMLHRACKYAAQGLHIYCTGLANMLHEDCKYAAQSLQVCCTEPAHMLHRACKHAAQGLQVCCTRFAEVLHRACKYAAQGPPICCKVSGYGCTSLTKTICAHVALRGVCRVCCTELANMLHAACKHGARPAVARHNIAQSLCSIGLAIVFRFAIIATLSVFACRVRVHAVRRIGSSSARTTSVTNDSCCPSKSPC